MNALVDLPHLKSVTVLHTRNNISFSKPPEVHAAEVVKSFKGCALLMELEIVDNNLWNRSPLIAEAAAAYDRKDFDMFIGRTQYRTW